MPNARIALWPSLRLALGGKRLPLNGHAVPGLQCSFGGLGLCGIRDNPATRLSVLDPAYAQQSNAAETPPSLHV